MYPIVNKLHALNGDTWSTPASTLNAFWSALGAGADALTLSVFLTKDKTVVCTPSNQLLSSAGKRILVEDLTLTELQAFEAGATFRSTKLDEHGQPTGQHGEDLPWQTRQTEAPLKNRKALFYPTLRQVFELFSRRTDIRLKLPDESYSNLNDLTTALVNTLQQFGLQDAVTVIGPLDALRDLRALLPSTPLCPETDKVCTNMIDRIVELKAKILSVRYETIHNLPENERTALFQSANKHDIGWCFYSDALPYAPDQNALKALEKYRCKYDCKIEAWQSKGVLPSARACAASHTVFSEAFQGKQLDTAYWSGGYSHINTETRITVEDKLIINISEGKQYSGGAAICLLPIHGDFDAEVSFHVQNPHQATTFELAAIGVDPGYHHINNSDLDTRKVNLTFDVHGSPPYASSERDQNDAFRCGWNNSFNFAKFGGKESPEWEASSSNMYNKYGRGVGDGSPANPTGKLRLTRKGDLFNSYYRDAHNSEWVCSGTMLVQNLPTTTYLRLAAKHWHKIDPAPGNVVSFWDFTFSQPVV